MRTRRSALGGQHRPGMSLNEILVVLVALGVCMLLGVSILRAALRAEQAAARVHHDMQVRNLLADQFRADVNGATAAVDAQGELKAGATCLILRQPNGKHLAYRWEEGRLERSVAPDEEDSWRPIPVGHRCAGVSFAHDAAERRLVTLRLVEPRGNRAEGPALAITALVGGSLR